MQMGSAFVTFKHMVTVKMKLLSIAVLIFNGMTIWSQLKTILFFSLQKKFIYSSSDDDMVIIVDEDA